MPGVTDTIVLQRGSSVQDRLQTATRRWRESGRAADHLLTGAAFFMAQCWLYASGRREPQPGFQSGSQRLCRGQQDGAGRRGRLEYFTVAEGTLLRVSDDVSSRKPR